jgi:hypothetical protein
MDQRVSEPLQHSIGVARLCASCVCCVLPPSSVAPLPVCLSASASLDRVRRRPAHVFLDDFVGGLVYAVHDGLKIIATPSPSRCLLPAVPLSSFSSRLRSHFLGPLLLPCTAERVGRAREARTHLGLVLVSTVMNPTAAAVRLISLPAFLPLPLLLSLGCLAASPRPRWGARRWSERNGLHHSREQHAMYCASRCCLIVGAVAVCWLPLVAVQLNTRPPNAVPTDDSPLSSCQRIGCSPCIPSHAEARR